MRFLKRKKCCYSIDEHLNKQVMKDINRRKTGVIIFITVMLCVFTAFLTFILWYSMSVFNNYFNTIP